MLMGDTPATLLTGGPGEDGEGLDRELRHLETEEGIKHKTLACLKTSTIIERLEL